MDIAVEVHEKYALTTKHRDKQPDDEGTLPSSLQTHQVGRISPGQVPVPIGKQTSLYLFKDFDAL